MLIAPPCAGLYALTPNRCTVHFWTVVSVGTDFVKNLCQHGPGDAPRVHVEATRVEARDDPQVVIYIDRDSMFERLPDVEEF